MYPHRIRLHGPWQFAPQAATVISPNGQIELRSAPLPEAGRIRVPRAWRGTELDGFRGRVQFKRVFHSPGTLDSNERLWLVFEGVDYFADIYLNGEMLGRHEGFFESFEFEITSLVRAHNELVIDVDCPAEADSERKRLIRGFLETLSPSYVGGLWNTIAIEVRSVACLRNVAIQSSYNGSVGMVSISGLVIGESDSPLAIDLSIDGKLLAGQRVESSAEGRRFSIEARLVDVEPWSIADRCDPKCYRMRLELHGLARTLDRIDCHIGFRHLVFDAERDVIELNGRSFRVCRVSVGVEGLESCLSRQQPVVHRMVSEKVGDNGTLVLYQVHGHVLSPPLYDAADLQGLLLQQGFPLLGSCSTESDLKREAVRQAKVMVRQLGHHPAIAAWSCHAESVEHNYELDDTVRKVILLSDQSRICLGGARYT